MLYDVLINLSQVRNKLGNIKDHYQLQKNQVMIYSGLQLVIKAVQNGWDTHEESYDDLKVDLNFLSYACTNERIKDIEIIQEIYECININDESSFLRNYCDEDILFSNWTDCNDWKRLYYALEDKTWMYGPDIKDLDNVRIQQYLNMIPDDDKNYSLFLKSLNFKDYMLNCFAKDDLVEENDIKRFMSENLNILTIDIAMSIGFQNALNEISENQNGIYSNTYDDKLNIIGTLLELFDWNEELIDKLCSEQYGVYEESFDEDLESAGYAKIEKESKKEDVQNNRISYDEACSYINNNSFSEDIQISEGYMGSEDMNFDHIHINGRLIGETFNFKPWISDRDFGDYKIAEDWFFKQVNKYLLSEDNK